MLMTERLLLRDFEEGDWPAVHQYASSPEAIRYRAHEPETQEQTKEYVKRATEQAYARPRTAYELAVVSKDDGQLLGVCELYIENFHHVSNFDASQARIGYGLQPQYWGRGYATEAVRALVMFGFKKLGLHRIYAPVTPANIASAKVLEKIGMRREGHFRESLWMKGEWVDVLLYGILAREWAVS